MNCANIDFVNLVWNIAWAGLFFYIGWRIARQLF